MQCSCGTAPHHNTTPCTNSDFRFHVLSVVFSPHSQIFQAHCYQYLSPRTSIISSIKPVSHTHEIKLYSKMMVFCFDKLPKSNSSYKWHKKLINTSEIGKRVPWNFFKIFKERVSFPVLSPSKTAVLSTTWRHHSINIH